MGVTTLMLLTGLALAEEAPAAGTDEAPSPPVESAETPPAPTPPPRPPAGPLAIPADTPSPDGRPGRPMAQPGNPPLDAERLRLLRTYRAQRLSLRPETEIRQGPATATTWGYGGWGYGGWGYGGWGYGGFSTTVINNPVWTSRTWGIYQGHERLSVPRFLEVAGDQARATELRATIGKSQKRAKAWYTVAGVGAAGILTGIVGMGMAKDIDGYRVFNNVALGGIGLTVTGMLGGSFPSAKASRLARTPSAVLTAQEAQGYVDGHNERLQDELGLTAQEVWTFEMGASEGR